MSLSDNAAFVLELASVGFAVLYLALAIPQSLWCWPAALISTAIWFVVAFDARLYMDAGLQIFYFAMAIYGWHQWRSGGEEHTGVHVHRWRPGWHAIVVAMVLVISVFSALILGSTDAAFPFLDSLTTVAGIVATFMVVREVLENWFYWFVIDAVYVWLYLSRDLYFYAGLYLVYLVMIVFGFRAWLASYRAEGTGRDDRVAA